MVCVFSGQLVVLKLQIAQEELEYMKLLLIIASGNAFGKSLDKVINIFADFHWPFKDLIKVFDQGYLIKIVLFSFKLKLQLLLLSANNWLSDSTHFIFDEGITS